MSVEYLSQRHLVVAVLRGALFQLAEPLLRDDDRLRRLRPEDDSTVPLAEFVRNAVEAMLSRAANVRLVEEITRVVAVSQYWGCPPRVLPDPLDRYLKKVVAAGGFTAYERAHRARLVAMLVPKLTHMPADAISHMVDFAFHVGFY